VPRRRERSLRVDVTSVSNDRQVRPTRRGLGTEGLRTLFFVLYPLLAIVVVPIALVGASTGVRGDELFNDPAYELGLLWGIFSYFGILMWAAGTACCLVAWTFLTRTSRSHPLRPWFLASAVLSGALTIDDTFLVHDVVLSDYAGIPEVLVLLGYAAAIGWYFIRFRRELLDRADSAVFLASVLLLGSSLAIDVAIQVIGSFPLASTIEDLPKLLGITAWVYFFYRATLEVVTETHSSPRVPPREA
jgi:hypothetical protein